jgi:DNA-binding transcriptional MerR regulator
LTDAPRYYSIGAVARRTGLSEHMLRVWERRYRVVAPERSRGRHRRYSEHDVRRLRLLRAAQRGGCSIGELAPLTDAQIIAVLQQAANGSPPTPPPLADQIDACEQAIERLDPWLLTAILNRAVTGLGHVAVAESLIAPVMQRVGNRWSERELEPHHEHLASATFRTFLGAALAQQPPARGAPAAVAGTLSGERHELGILAAAVVAAAEGWRVVYLGPDTPARSMVATLAAHRPGAVLLGFAGSPVPPSRLHALQVVVRSAAAGAIVLCGGAAVHAAPRAIEARGAVVADLGATRATLRTRLAADDQGAEPARRMRT